jgi:hypothetical protein
MLLQGSGHTNTIVDIEEEDWLLALCHFLYYGRGVRLYRAVQDVRSGDVAVFVCASSITLDDGRDSNRISSLIDMPGSNIYVDETACKPLVMKR